MPAGDVAQTSPLATARSSDEREDPRALRRRGGRTTPAGRVRLSLSDLVARTGVPASTIHHYRKAGLIPMPERLAANRFYYGEDHVEAVRTIRLLRERRGLSLGEIAVVLPELLDDPGGPTSAALAASPTELGDEIRSRLVEEAIEQLSTQSYAEVTMSHIASAAGVAKGTLYRHFPSKEALFAAVVEELVDDTARRFAVAVEHLGGPQGLAQDPEKAATVFARLVAGAMPIMLELGVRAAKGHADSEAMARRLLRTLAEAAGRPLADDSIPAGLAVIRNAFATVLDWAVLPEWPDEAEETKPTGDGPGSVDISTTPPA